MTLRAKEIQLFLVKGVMLGSFGILFGLGGMWLIESLGFAIHLPNFGTSGSKGVGGSAHDSPIVVSGGAMTARTKDANGWQGPVGSTSYCSDGDTSSIVLSGVAAPGLSPTPLPIAFTNIDAKGGWTINVYGRRHDGKPDGVSSGNGFMLTAKNNDCASASGTSVTLATSRNGSFYEDDPSVNEDDNGGHSKNKTFAKRFQDSSSDCVKTVTGGGNDEDVCERATVITLTIPVNGISTTYTYRCPNGECVIGIGGD